MTKLYKYSGAGNLFLVVDAREGGADPFRDAQTISSLCRDARTDGLMILSESDSADFRMEFYNPDGSHGMMCGNGGRCIVAFAGDLGVLKSRSCTFEAPDAVHNAEILSESEGVSTIKLQMRKPSAPERFHDGFFIDTGARHFVKIVADTESVDVSGEGPVVRHRPEFAPEGVNVDFVQILPDGSLRVRTFEKGVEAETPACGTGIVAAAAVALSQGLVRGPIVSLRARSDTLTVDLSSREPCLTGPATQVRIDSTNNEARRLWASLPDRTVIVSDRQSSGRGQGDHVWYSTDGSNLTFSIVLRFPGGQMEASSLKALMDSVSLGVCSYLEGHGISPAIKYPNDILVDGKKICGILIETFIEDKTILGAIVGVGFDLNETIWPEYLPEAVSLRQLTGRTYERGAELDSLLAHIDRSLEKLRNGK